MATRIHETITQACRYCLNSNEPSVHHLYLDAQDKYERMLEDTFNIRICFSEHKYLCVECVKDISKAAEIKKRVIEVQNTLLLKRNEKWIKLDNESPKKEIDFEECGFEDCSDLGITEASGGTATGTGIRTTPELDSGIPKIKQNMEVVNCDEYLVEKASINMVRLKNEISDLKRKTAKSVSDARIVVNKFKKKQKESDNTKRGKLKVLPATKSLIVMKKNTLIMINNSNMCLFNSKRTKYACFFCKDVFLDIIKLRTHSLTHKTDKIDYSIRMNRGLTMKNVDISNLTCKKCSHPCVNLEELRVHLKNNHDEAIEGTEHLLVPFKIEQGFECVICQKKFLNFLSLSIHMNCHSSYNVCEMCGASFTNRLGLRNHIASVHREKKCSKCTAVFPTAAAKNEHLRLVHKKKKIVKNYCTQCEMIFIYSYKLKQHMVEKHGVKKTLNICEICNKIFSSAAGVKTHYKSVHLRMRKHICDVCDMSFFTSFDKKRHEVSHGDDSPFSCDSCDDKFKSKDSLRRHLKRKHGT